MSDPSIETLAKIFDLLRQDQGIALLVSDRIYNSIPKDPDYPCMILQSLTERDNSAECVELYQEFFTLQIWSEYLGQKKVKDLARKTRRLLKDQAFILDDGQSIEINMTHISYPKMNDDAMSEALIEFNFYYEDLED